MERSLARYQNEAQERQSCKTQRAKPLTELSSINLSTQTGTIVQSQPVRQGVSALSTQKKEPMCGRVRAAQYISKRRRQAAEAEPIQVQKSRSEFCTTTKEHNGIEQSQSPIKGAGDQMSSEF